MKPLFSVRRRFSRAIPGILAALFLFSCAPRSVSRTLRIATWNVEHGIGSAESRKGAAQRAILRRVNADIVAFQELTRRTLDEWERLAGELGYPYHACGENGPFSGGLLVGFFSRFPIVESASVRSPGDAREFSRFPFRIAVTLPGSHRLWTLWNIHHKALFRPADDFRRAVEATRIVQDVERVLAENPGRKEWIILGDMNDAPGRDDIVELPPQSDLFHAVPSGLPKTYTLGSNIVFPLPYRSFPLDVYRKAGSGAYDIHAVREATGETITHFFTNLRLDYIFVSPAIWNHSQGRPVGEVYHSDWETGAGRPKFGERPPLGSSRVASDHYVVFVDVQIGEDPDDGSSVAD